MSGGAFFPNNDNESGQIVWLSRYALKLPIHGPVCGINAHGNLREFGGHPRGFA